MKNWRYHPSGFVFDNNGDTVCRLAATAPALVNMRGNAISAAPELLAIVRHLHESFQAGADRVYRDSIGMGEDDATLAEYVAAAIEKAEAR